MALWNFFSFPFLFFLPFADVYNKCQNSWTIYNLLIAEKNMYHQVWVVQRQPGELEGNVKLGTERGQEPRARFPGDADQINLLLGRPAEKGFLCLPPAVLGS